MHLLWNNLKVQLWCHLSFNHVTWFTLVSCLNTQCFKKIITQIILFTLSSAFDTLHDLYVENIRNKYSCKATMIRLKHLFRRYHLQKEKKKELVLRHQTIFDTNRMLEFLFLWSILYYDFSWNFYLLSQNHKIHGTDAGRTIWGPTKAVSIISWKHYNEVFFNNDVFLFNNIFISWRWPKDLSRWPEGFSAHPLATYILKFWLISNLVSQNFYFQYLKKFRIIIISKRWNKICHNYDQSWKQF